MTTIDEMTEGLESPDHSLRRRGTVENLQKELEGTSEEDDVPNSPSQAFNSARDKINKPLGAEGKTFEQFKQQQSSNYMTQQTSQGRIVDDFSSHVQSD